MSSSDGNKNLAEIEYSIKRRLDYEHATVECMRTLLEPGSLDDILPRILDIVHGVVDNSRTYIFKNEQDSELGLCMSQVYETISDGINAQIDNPNLQRLPYKEATPSLFPVLESRQHYSHLVKELDEPERTILSEQGIISILIIPIYAGQEFWGFIGFDDCIKARDWDKNDIDLLRMVADGIGEFIFRKRSEDELRESEERYKVLHNATFGGILIHDKGKILDCNQGLSNMTGYSKEELLANDSFIIATDDSKAIIMEKLASGSEEPYEIVGRRKDGTEYPMRVQGKKIPYKGKQLRVTELKDITKEKEAERALRESEERFKALHEGSFGGIFIHMDGTIIDCNLGLSKITGYTPEELIGMDGLLLIAEMYRDRARNNMQTGHEESFEAVGLRKGGTEYPIFTQAKNIPYKERNVRVVEYRDITKQKKSEKALRESEEKLNAMIENIADVISIVDENGINIYKSPNIEKWFGWKPEEIINTSVFDNIHPEDRNKMQEGFASLLNTPKATLSSTARYLCKDGKCKWIEFTAINLLSEPAIKGVLFNYRDITERKKAEDSLLESEGKFRNYIENAPYGIFIIDDQGNYLEVNKTACTLTGYDEDELVNMNATDLIATESLIRAGQNLDELKNAGFSSTELQLKHKDNTISWIKKDGAKLSDNRFILFISDITEKKKAEHSLIEAKILAEHNNRIKSEFLANMSHELRTPLTTVIGFSDILQEGMAGELAERQLKYVEHVNKNAKHLLEIINDILDLSKIEAGKMELECEDFYVPDLINETLKSMDTISGKKNIKLKLVDNINNGHIHADRIKIQQILYNLLSNAIKFTPDNGEVFVSIERSNNGIQVSVKDTGIGIPAEMQKEIFSPFTQVDASNKRRYGGTGLGLALVKQFVEMHNGKVWLESEEGKGSNFSFTIEDQKKED